MKRMFRILKWIVICFVGFVALLFLLVWIFSGNTPEGGTKIAKKGWAQIGGIEQGYFYI